MRQEDFIARIDSAAHADDAGRIAILESLAREADQVVAHITVEYHYMGRWRELFTLLTLIGYPGSDPALPWIAEHIDRNSSARTELIDLLRSIPPSALAPHLIKRLLAPDHAPSWGYEIEGLCDALQQLASDYTSLCLPTLVYLLSLNLDPALLDPGFLLDTIERSPSAEMSLAAPTLLMLLRSSSWPETVATARNLFASLPLVTKQMYRFVEGYPEA